MRVSRARTTFKAQVLEWAVKLNVVVGAIQVRRLRGKWASCSKARTISFKEDLIELDPTVSDYITVCELLRLHATDTRKLRESPTRVYPDEHGPLKQKLNKAAVDYLRIACHMPPTPKGCS